MQPQLPNVILILVFALGLLAPIMAWAIVAWRKRRVGLMSLFALVAVEAVLLFLLRQLFL